MLAEAKQRRARQIAAVVSAAATMMVASQSVLSDGSHDRDRLVNKSSLKPDRWVYGPAFNAPANSPIWNPAKIRMNAGLLTNGGTIGSVPAETELLQHRKQDGRGLERLHVDRSAAQRDGLEPGLDHVGVSVRPQSDARARGRAGCAHLVHQHPGDREGPRRRRHDDRPAHDGQRRGGAGTSCRWSTTRRSASASTARASGRPSTRTCPVATAQTFNDNVVVWVMIETIEGSQDAYEIAQVPGIHGVFGATGDLGNFSGFVERAERLRLPDHAHPQRRAFRGQAGVHVPSGSATGRVIPSPAPRIDSAENHWFEPSRR